MQKGRFIVIDGGEGSGKSSVMKALREHFSENTTIFTREPGGTTLAEDIRDILLADSGKSLSPAAHFALFSAARLVHIERLVQPALQEGKNVISDRFDSTTFAIQVWTQSNNKLVQLFWQMREHYTNLGGRPYLYVYLDVDPEVGMFRTKTRGDQNHFDLESLEFHHKVRQGFKEFMVTVPCRTVDSNQPIEKVVEEVLEIVKSALA